MMRDVGRSPRAFSSSRRPRSAGWPTRRRGSRRGALRSRRRRGRGHPPPPPPGGRARGHHRRPDRLLLRGQRGGAHARAGRGPARRGARGARHRCRHAERLRPRLPARGGGGGARITVTAVPGPSAVLTALAVSGLPVDRFCFEGFLPRKAGEAVPPARHPRRRGADDGVLRGAAPHRRPRSRRWPRRSVPTGGAVCRELTKTYEEVRRGGLAELAAWADDGVRGEVTIVVTGATPPPPSAATRRACGCRRRARGRRHAAEGGDRRGGAAGRRPEARGVQPGARPMTPRRLPDYRRGRLTFDVPTGTARR